VVSQWIGIQTDPGNFVLLYFPLVLIWTSWFNRSKIAGLWFTLLSGFVLLFGLWALFLSTVQKGYQPEQNPIMFVPLPLFLLVGLYWVRWWAVRPRKLYLDELRELE
jgi:hypothetical protein